MFVDIEIGRDKLLTAAGRIDQLGQRTISVGTHHQRHVFGLLEQLGTQSLRHAPSYANETAGRHELLELTQPPHHPLLSVFANGARVHKNHISAIRCINRAITGRRQLAVHQFRIGDIHLATVRLDIHGWLHQRRDRCRLVCGFVEVRFDSRQHVSYGRI